MRAKDQGNDETFEGGAVSFNEIIDLIDPSRRPSDPLSSAGNSPPVAASVSVTAPGGANRDAFPESLAAHHDAIRSVSAYLREQGIIGGDQASPPPAPSAPAEPVGKPNDRAPFAIGGRARALAATARGTVGR